jgi:hypothetical protein
VESERSAQENKFADTTAVAVLMLDTSTEVSLSTVVPSPKFPLLFSPQHRTLPSLITTQAWLFPNP